MKYILLRCGHHSSGVFYASLLLFTTTSLSLFTATLSTKASGRVSFHPLPLQTSKAFKKTQCYFSHFHFSLCLTVLTIHGSCVYIYMRGVGAWSRHHGCLLTNTPAPVCPSLWLTPNSRISRAQTIPVSRPGYFPRVPARLLAPLPYIPPLCGEWDLPWRTMREEKSEDGHKSRSQAACAGTGITWHGHGCCLPGLGLDTTPRKLIF